MPGGRSVSCGTGVPPRCASVGTGWSAPRPAARGALAGWSPLPPFLRGCRPLRREQTCHVTQRHVPHQSRVIPPLVVAEPHLLLDSPREGLIMAKPLLPDELWELIRPLIPPHPPQPKGGRPWLDDRKALTGIIFVLKTGIPWEDLPQEMGCGCGMTCWNRLRDWQAAGLWDKIHQLLLTHLRHADKIDFHRFIVDSSHVRAVGGGEETGPSPVDRRKKGSKHEVLTDGNGVPLD